MPLLDQLDQRLRLCAARAILCAYARLVRQDRLCRDPLLLHALLDLGRLCHSSIDALSIEDERRLITNLLINVLRSAEFGGELEAALQFLVEARQHWSQLDAVQVEIIHRSFSIMDSCSVRVAKQQPQQTALAAAPKKLQSFIRSCIAFALVTIPSLDDPVTRLQMYCRCAATALQWAALGQAEAALRIAISMICERNGETNSSSEVVGSDAAAPPTNPNSVNQGQLSVTQTASIAGTLCSLLLLYPSLDRPFAMVQGFVNALSAASQSLDSPLPPASRCVLAISILRLLAAMWQRRFFLQIPGLQSNDAVHASGFNAQYRSELQNIYSTTVEFCLGELSAIGQLDLAVRVPTSLFCAHSHSCRQRDCRRILHCNSSTH